jgi:hypothetical protein
MEWWMWLLLGLVLLGIEVGLPGGIVMLFFGVAALIVGGLVGIGIGGAPWMQYLLFSIISIGSLLTLRGPILRTMATRSNAAEKVDTLINQAVVALDTLAPGGEGRVELRGTTWSAQNIGDTLIRKGQKCVVARNDGLKLFVRPE